MYIKSLKFSLWADFIERDFLDKEFKELIKKGIVNGATSNPAIFKNAILNSFAYKEQLKKLNDKTPKEKYEELAIFDIQKAADILMPLYEKNDEGFVSIEVDPNYANDTKNSIEEAKYLWNKIDRKNLMIKIPVTDEGCEAIEELVSEGINVNATLIFDPKYAIRCLDAIEKGLKRSSKTPYTVLSIFVSRFDRKLDPILEKKGLQKGKVGIYNAAKIYNIIQKRDIPNCKALFASTGVKGDDYPQDYYITNLLASNSINTAPIHTIKSFVKSKKNEAKLPIDDEKIDNFFQELKNSQIDMQKVYNDLLEEGIMAFKEAFKDILDELE